MVLVERYLRFEILTVMAANGLDHGVRVFTTGSLSELGV